MSTGRIEKFWVVRNPSEVSTLDDIVFETTIESLILQAKGGLSVEERPRMHLDRQSAEADAFARIAVRRALSAMAGGRAVGDVRSARKLHLLDAEGAVIFEAEIGA